MLYAFISYLYNMPSDNFPHDAAYKNLFSYPEMVKSLLLDFVPYEFVKDFDFQTLKPCKSSFVGSEYIQRYNDVVWRAKWSGEECYICIMLEFQSSQDQHMALRILTYTALLLNDQIKNSPDRASGKLPPVFPIVLYNGEKPWKAALNIHDLIEAIHDDLSPYQPSQQYFLIDEKRIPKDLLEAAKGDAKYIFEAEQADKGDSIYKVAVNFSESRAVDMADKLKQDMFQWLALKIRKVEPAWLDAKQSTKEDGLMLADIVDAHLQKVHEQKQQYIDEGIEQGILRGLNNQKDTLLEMLSECFGEIPTNWKEKIDVQTDPIVLKDLIKSVWKVDSMADFEKLLKNSGKQ